MELVRFVERDAGKFLDAAAVAAREIESLESRPRYGETLTLLIEGKQVRAKVKGVWQQPPWPASGIYMINADEIE
jgi:hypothetical protein